MTLVVMRNVFSFRGRADRSTFAITTLALLGITYLAGALLCVGLASLGSPLPANDVPAFLASLRLPAPLAWIGLGVGLVGIVVVLIGSLAVCVRRLHDAGQSGLLVLLFFVVAPALPSMSWSSFLPPLPYSVWNGIMLALPHRPRSEVDRSGDVAS
ncbi:hypothetical protein RHAL1_02817 [Beijerinckiaceae bacterium RH AL1]|nr:DUF805 domain-containing protein [Beijerinckiaceae bacterium]VVB47448.1 hypothetical protein RHCH11_RHCH11_02757 [Beijerinckiaceae bacterium RH CH11]VVB47530.1 hypothetical protein RHAL8_02753 [Beijerinckiaceae bacterium RH AL8]VVC55894.1 hypothetical protein RHAL1_02817 [Beijerinckiaceae bacterium RH AL1]